ncbi:MAG: B-box zinc finger protein [Anaerolineales bacterium]|jgi:hypothetical protein
MTEQTLVCANHPDRETTLRCNRCEKPICAQCAVQTPVGYRCRECVKGQQKIFDNSTTYDIPLAALISMVCVGGATAVLDFLGFWGLFVAPVVGGGIAEIIRWAVRRRRSRTLPVAAVAGGVLGVLIYLGYQLSRYVPMFMYAGADLGQGWLSSVLITIAWPVGYALLMLGALFARLRGIQL